MKEHYRKVAQEEQPVEEQQVKKDFEIPTYNYDHFIKRIDRLNRIAAKLGVPPVVVTKTGETEKWVPKWWDAEPDIEGRVPRVLVQFIKVHIEGEAPVLNGWEFVATLDHRLVGEKKDQLVNVLRVVPGKEVEGIERYRNSPPWCDHCKKPRHRSGSFIVRNVETGELKQVGRNCLKDFLGHPDPQRYASWAEMLADLKEESEDPEPGSWGGFGEAVNIKLEDMLPVAVAVIRLHGWVSSARARGELGTRSTSNRIYHYFFPDPDPKPQRGVRYESDRELNRAIRSSITEEDKKLAAEALEWVRSIPPDTTSTYLGNLRAIGLSGSIGYKDFGLAASIIKAYERRNEQEKERQERTDVAETIREHQQNLGYIGNVGERREFELELVKATYDIGTQFGSATLFIFRDINGNQVKWFTSTAPDLEEGKTYKLVGTVKSHDEYRGVKQTSLVRVKVVGGETKEVAQEPTTASYRKMGDMKPIWEMTFDDFIEANTMLPAIRNVDTGEIVVGERGQMHYELSQFDEEMCGGGYESGWMNMGQWVGWEEAEKFHGAIDSSDVWDIMWQKYRDSVKNAIEEGKPVPPAVLKDYDRMKLQASYRSLAHQMLPASPEVVARAVYEMWMKIIKTTHYRCDTMSGLVGTILKHMGHDPIMSEGYFEADDEGSHYHFWIELDGNIIDVSADQFNEYGFNGIPSINVVPVDSAGNGVKVIDGHKLKWYASQRYRLDRTLFDYYDVDDPSYSGLKTECRAIIDKLFPGFKRLVRMRNTPEDYDAEGNFRFRDQFVDIFDWQKVDAEEKPLPSDRIRGEVGAPVAAAFRKFEDWAGEVFSWGWGKYRWDIELAEKIIAEHPRETRPINVEEWASAILHYTYDPDDPKKRPVDFKEMEKGKTYHMHLGTGVDWKHVDEVDLSRPLIIALLDGKPMLIDGNHRLAKAWKNGVEQLQVYVLTQEESDRVMESAQKNGSYRMLAADYALVSETVNLDLLTEIMASAPPTGKARKTLSADELFPKWREYLSSLLLAGRFGLPYDEAEKAVAETPIFLTFIHGLPFFSQTDRRAEFDLRGFFGVVRPKYDERVVILEVVSPYRPPEGEVMKKIGMWLWVAWSHELVHAFERWNMSSKEMSLAYDREEFENKYNAKPHPHLRAEREPSLATIIAFEDQGLNHQEVLEAICNLWNLSIDQGEYLIDKAHKRFYGSYRKLADGQVELELDCANAAVIGRFEAMKLLRKYEELSSQFSNVVLKESEWSTPEEPYWECSVFVDERSLDRWLALLKSWGVGVDVIHYPDGREVVGSYRKLAINTPDEDRREREELQEKLQLLALKIFESKAFGEMVRESGVLDDVDPGFDEIPHDLFVQTVIEDARSMNDWGHVGDHIEHHAKLWAEDLLDQETVTAADIKNAAKEVALDSLKYDVQSRLDDFNSLEYPKPVYEVWRAIRVKSIKDFTDKISDGVGVYWAWDEEHAIPHWGYGDDKKYDIVLHGEVKHENIDWKETLSAALEMDDENELRVKEGAPVLLRGYDVEGQGYFQSGLVVKASANDAESIA